MVGVSFKAPWWAMRGQGPGRELGLDDTTLTDDFIMVLVSVCSSNAGSMSPTLISALGTSLAALEATRADAKEDREAMEACIVLCEEGNDLRTVAKRARHTPHTSGG